MAWGTRAFQALGELTARGRVGEREPPSEREAQRLTEAAAKEACFL